MKKFLAVLMITLLCGTCLIACGSKDDGSNSKDTKGKLDTAIVGTWDDSLLPKDQQLGCYWTFKKNGTGVNGLFDETFKYTASDGKMHLTYDSGLGEYDYTYEIKDDVITLTEVTEETQIPYQYKKKK